MYTRKEFGKELKERVARRQNTTDIGNWVYSIYLQHRIELDLSFKSFLLDLSTMEGGFEFGYSYEALNDIADRLIAGEDVQL